MAALPYIQLYVADYIADTMHLSTEEHGAYLLIIMNYWQTGKPLRLDRIPNITKLGDRWYAIKDCILELLEIDGDCVIPIKNYGPERKRPYSVEFETNRKILLKNHNGFCHYCNASIGPFEIDHIFPFSLGGTDAIENLVVSCRTCNRSKGNKTISEWEQCNG